MSPQGRAAASRGDVDAGRLTLEGYKKYVQETSVPRGPRAPAGITGHMDLSTESDLRLAFQRLVTDGENGLHRGQARQWLRAVGFISGEESLNDMLTCSRPGQSVARKIDVGVYSATELKETRDQHKFGEWQLEDLMEILEANRESPNGSVPALREALCDLSGGQTHISRHRLRDLLDTYGGMSHTELESILRLTEFRNKETLRVDELAQVLLDAVTHPPSVTEMDKMHAR